MVRVVVWLTVLVGCGRLGFDGRSRGDVDASTIDAAPITIHIGERPGDTSLGTIDTYLDPLSPTVAHGLQPGLQCDIPDVTLFQFTLPAGPPGVVLDAKVHIGVTTDLLEAGVVELREMLLPWSEAESSWNDQRAGVPWAIAGAGGAYGAPFGTFDGRTLFTDYVVSVPSDVVDRWWNGTSFGIAITVTATGVNFGSHEDPMYPDLRPELVLTYVP